MWTVTTYHGENGSLAYVVSEAEECAAIYSTIRHGAQWRELALAHRDRLNTPGAVAQEILATGTLDTA